MRVRSSVERATAHVVGGDGGCGSEDQQDTVDGVRILPGLATPTIYISVYSHFVHLDLAKREITFATRNFIRSRIIGFRIVARGYRAY